MRDTRYYPGGVKFFFEHLRDDSLVSSDPSKIETFLSTHPDPIDRISNVNKLLMDAGIEVKSYNSTGTDIYHDEYNSNVGSKFR